MAKGTDTANLAKVEHIVVLMLENRSFDHMLGYLAGGRPRRRRRASAGVRQHL
jgi:phospholipase C